MEKYFLSCAPSIYVHPVDESFANLGFKLFLCGLSAYLRALCVQQRFVGSVDLLQRPENDVHLPRKKDGWVHWSELHARNCIGANINRSLLQRPLGMLHFRT